MRLTKLLPLFLAFSALPLSAQSTPPTLTVDPVELVAGEEIQGSRDVYVDRFRFRYLFKSEANRTKFLEEPERYEIQLGGGCARMGPLSGTGTPAIRAVYEGRLYIFASEGCRSSFLSAPERVLDRPDEPPAVTPESEARGRELLTLALNGMGGALAVDGVRVYTRGFADVVDHQGVEYKRGERHAVRLDSGGGVRMEQWYGDWTRASVVAGDDSWFEEDGGVVAMHPQQRTAVLKDVARNPLVILRERSKPGTIAVASGKGEVDGTPVEFLTLASGGATTKLGIDVETGRVLSASYRGRGPDALFGVREVRFSDFGPVGALTLPKSETVWFEGAPSPDQSRTWTTQEVDGELDEALFRKPAEKGKGR